MPELRRVDLADLQALLLRLVESGTVIVAHTPQADLRALQLLDELDGKLVDVAQLGPKTEAAVGLQSMSLKRMAAGSWGSRSRREALVAAGQAAGGIAPERMPRLPCDCTRCCVPKLHDQAINRRCPVRSAVSTVCAMGRFDQRCTKEREPETEGVAPPWVGTPRCNFGLRVCKWHDIQIMTLIL